MIPCSVVAYDAAGKVVGTLDYLVARDAAGVVLGLVDFAAHEAAGGAMTDFWTYGGATGAKVWPEWLGSAAHDFDVELAGPAGAKRLVALRHRQSGYRRTLANVEGAVQKRIAAADGAPADIRDLVGGPNRPLMLDAEGRNRA